MCIIIPIFLYPAKPESVLFKDSYSFRFSIKNLWEASNLNIVDRVLCTARLQGKVAIITGGASGIGATAAKIFHANGAKVVIADVQDKLGQAVADKLGEGVCYIHCDVSNEHDIINLVDTIVAKYGKLDIMYNNTGNLDLTFGKVLDTRKSDVERLLAVNTVGGFLVAKHAARVMVPQRKGCILFTACDCTEIAGPVSPAYTVSKYGILGIVKSLAAELGQYGIRVNCISTMGQKGNRRGQVLKTEGIANAALYLASDETSYVSGQNLEVDGGFSVLNPNMMRALNLIK